MEHQACSNSRFRGWVLALQRPCHHPCAALRVLRHLSVRGDGEAGGDPQKGPAGLTTPPQPRQEPFGSLRLVGKSSSYTSNEFRDLGTLLQHRFYTVLGLTCARMENRQ